MKILAIETSCDDTAIAVLEIKRRTQIRVLSNVVSSQVKIHAPYGGVFPSLAAREHQKNLPRVLKLALKHAGLKSPGEADWLAVTQGPGLEIALWRGINFAQALAKKHRKPLIGVNHLAGHIFSNWLKTLGETAPLFPLLNEKKYPILNLVVSGGHTQLVLMTSLYKFKLLGETLDDAAGECFDKTARLLKLDYPGGPAVAKEAAKFKAKSEKQKIKLPRPMIKTKDFNFSFSGLKTAVLYTVRELRKNQPLVSFRSILAHEIQTAITEVLVYKTLKAAQECNAKIVTLSGGVSANQHLRQTLAGEIKRQLPTVKFLKPLMEYTTDQAAMIGLAGYLPFLKDKRKIGFLKKPIKAQANLTL